MSKYLAAVLAIAGVVSGQDYSPAAGSSAAATTTSAAAASSSAANSAASSAAPSAASSSTVSVVVPPTTTPSSIVAVSPDSSITDTSSLPYTTEIFYYCTTPTYSAAGPFVTIFNTFFIDVCSTGITQVAYTITDTCGCQHETDYNRPTGCPSGFTTTEKTCTACPGSPVITCTTPIGSPIETSNPITGTAGSPGVNLAGNPAGSTHGSNPQYPTQSYVQQPGSTPSSAPGTHPSYETTNSAKPAAGSSPLGILMMTSMVLVASLMCIL